MALPKLDPDFKAKWVAALRSGTYQQGLNVMHTVYEGEHEWCCLGVAADVRNPSRWKIPQDGTCYWGRNDSAWDAVVPGAHLHPGAIKGLNKGTQILLAEMNDGGSSFAEIADWIEEHI